MGLSILELFLLVALFRLRRKGMEPANFEMAFDEYSSLRRGGSYRGVDETAPRPSAFRAFERLLSASLIACTDIRYFILLASENALDHEDIHQAWHYSRQYQCDSA